MGICNGKAQNMWWLSYKVGKKRVGDRVRLPRFICGHFTTNTKATILLHISMTEVLSGVVQVLRRCPDHCPECAEISLLSFWLSVSWGAWLGDFLLKPACPTEQVTPWESLSYLTSRSDTDDGVAQYRFFAPNWKSITRLWVWGPVIASLQSNSFKATMRPSRMVLFFHTSDHDIK